MISDILNALQRGSQVMRLNSRLLLVGVLLFVFPLLFVWVTQSFFTTAYNNIDTAEKLRVAMLHDSLASVLQSAVNPQDAIPALISVYAKENADITKIRVVDEIDDSFQILYASNPELIGTTETADELYRNLPLAGSTSSFIYETFSNGARTWQVFRSVKVGTQELYIFSEHSFAVIDSVMAARQQQSYLGLSAIFLFLIALAYWLNRQMSWEKQTTHLAAQLKERDLFSNMIAHEFRTPLTAIKGYASFLEESATLEQDERRFATNIRTSAERLVALVSDFLEVARLQSGKLSVTKTTVNMSDIMSQVADDLRPLARDKNIELVLEALDKKVPVQTDSGRMIQVLTNIVTNAIKYTDSGTVALQCTKTAHGFTVRIKDTGTGISAEDQQKLFAPFTRVGGVDATSVAGTGLGMWITRQLVELLGGTIGVESIKGVGTHVVIVFKN